MGLIFITVKVHFSSLSSDQGITNLINKTPVISKFHFLAGINLLMSTKVIYVYR